MHKWNIQRGQQIVIVYFISRRSIVLPICTYRFGNTKCRLIWLKSDQLLVGNSTDRIFPRRLEGSIWSIFFVSWGLISNLLHCFCTWRTINYLDEHKSCGFHLCIFCVLLNEIITTVQQQRMYLDRFVYILYTKSIFSPFFFWAKLRKGNFLMTGWFWNELRV